MLETRFVGSVAERDIDFLLLEEFSVSDDFRNWFVSKAAEGYEYHSKVGVWHSLVDSSLGESDIVFLYSSKLSGRIAILIENKINAQPQPEQAERYRQRGEKGVSKGHWNRFITCVVAPQRYLESSKHDQTYDLEISYEDLAVYFAQGGAENSRGLYKASLIKEAIEQNRRGYQPEYNQAMSEFVAHYYAIAVRRFSQLEMQAPKQRPSGSTWITFHPTVLPRGAYICHQLSAGAVKLFFGPPSSLEAVSEVYRPYLPDEVTIEQAGKSVALIVQVPRIDPLALPVSQQQEAVLLGLNAAEELLRFAQHAAASNNSLQRRKSWQDAP